MPAGGAVRADAVVDVPFPPTALLGRGHEVDDVAGLLRSGDVRLVTITGPGGVGKTRLALEVGHRVGGEFPDGAVFVDLAGVTEPGAVTPAIAHRLGVGETGAADPTVDLRRALARRALLLILDNYEQVLGAADVPAAILEACPGLRILVTSRAPLRVRAERVVRLAALPVPTPAARLDAAAVRGFASVELFCDRAAAIRSGFQLDDGNAEAIGAICRALDGLPLAIELAAARVNHLSPVVLRERLVAEAPGVPLDTLGRGAGDLPARQRTMRDTIAWSYGLLNPGEQRLLRDLAVFHGDCSLEAIDAVCSGSTPADGAGSEVDAPSLLDALAALVDLHLVEPVDRVPDEARFELLVTIREYGREQLDDAELLALRTRHARYFAGLVDEAARGLESPAAPTWKRRLEHELVELRGALRHLVATGAVVEGLRMVTGAGPFWRDHGHTAEGRRWLAELLDHVDQDLLPLPERTAALVWSARLAMDDHPLAHPDARSSVHEQLDEALALARSIHDEQLELEALLSSTFVALPDGEDLDSRIEAAEDGMARARVLNRWRLADLSFTTALLAHRAGHRERAARLATEAGALADELGNEQLSIQARIALSFTTPGTTLAGTAPELADIVPRAEALGNTRVLAWLYPAVASESLAAGRVVDATRWFRASLVLGRDSGYWHASTMGLMGTQAIAFLRGRPEVAAMLYGAVAPHLPQIRRSFPPAHVRSWEGFITAVRRTLGDDDFDAAARTGSAVTWDEAVNEAIAVCAVELDEPDVRRPAAASAPARAPEAPLTDRELEVLRRIASGDSNKDVAAALGIRPKTVMHHSVAIYRKLGVRGRAEATAYAYQHHLVESVPPA